MLNKNCNSHSSSASLIIHSIFLGQLSEPGLHGLKDDQD
jgi:hypothetical protein